VVVDVGRTSGRDEKVICTRKPWRDAPIAAGDTNRRTAAGVTAREIELEAVRCRPATVPAYCTRGDVGVQCQIARMRALSRRNGGRLTEEWTQWWRATLSTGPIVLVYDSSGNKLGAQRRAYGKRDVDGRPRV
jgi:hypothetical protein